MEAYNAKHADAPLDLASVHVQNKDRTELSDDAAVDKYMVTKDDVYIVPGTLPTPSAFDHNLLLHTTHPSTQPGAPPATTAEPAAAATSAAAPSPASAPSGAGGGAGASDDGSGAPKVPCQNYGCQQQFREVREGLTGTDWTRHYPPFAALPLVGGVTVTPSPFNSLRTRIQPACTTLGHQCSTKVARAGHAARTTLEAWPTTGTAS